MSEHQYVAFRAIDGPVKGKDLAYMKQQSSRAEITEWSFVNTYDFGDFHGNAREMLRRGYDFHLHYANFGIHTLMIRLPHGLPDPAAIEPYLDEVALCVEKDKRGPGRILRIHPCYEPGDVDYWGDLEELVEKLLPLRAEILDGDLRPLYLAHLAVGSDNNHDPDETREGPVPASLGRLTDAQRALADFYGLSESLLAAAARKSPPLTRKRASDENYAAWLQRQPEKTRTTWLAQLMADPQAKVRSAMLAEFRKTQHAGWPTVRLERTLTELRTATEAVQQQMDRKKADKAARQRAKELAAMAADPQKTLRETERLVKQRSSRSYEQAATLLADLREVLAGSARADLPEKQARKLKEEHPTLGRLIGQLKRKEFLKG